MTKQMVNSNIEWVKEIPKTWQIDRIKHLINDNLSIRRGKIDTNVLSLTTKGVVIKEDLLFGMNPENYDNHKIVHKGDYVICLRDLDGPLLCGISEYDGCLSGLYFVLRINEKKVTYKYFDLIMKSMGYVDALDGQSYGMRHSYNYEQFCELRVAFPSLEEQDKITAYLDRKCLKINELITKHNDIIEKLLQFKKTIITNAVTKGLNPNVKTKNSETNWIDKIPADWNIVPLKIRFNFGKGLSITKSDLVKNGLPVISYGQIHAKNCTGVHITNDLIRYVPEGFSIYKDSFANNNDFIFADTSEDLEGCGNCIYVDNDGVYAGYHTILLSSKYSDNNKYLGYLFKTDIWRYQIRTQLTEVKLYSITQSCLKQTEILLPTKDEQRDIVDYLDKKCLAIDELITRQKEAIEKLEEYKKSLIYNVITGKMEVK